MSIFRLVAAHLGLKTLTQRKKKSPVVLNVITLQRLPFSRAEGS